MFHDESWQRRHHCEIDNNLYIGTTETKLLHKNDLFSSGGCGILKRQIQNGVCLELELNLNLIIFSQKTASPKGDFQESPGVIQEGPGKFLCRMFAQFSKLFSYVCKTCKKI